MELNPKGLGFAGGVIWGFFVFLLSHLAYYLNYGKLTFYLLEDLYPGYGTHLIGSLIGFAYGFLDAFIVLYIFAWLYNKSNALFSWCCSKFS